MVLNVYGKVRDDLGVWSQTSCRGSNYYCYYYNHLSASFPGQSGWAGTRKVKPIWILLQQETVSGSVISWAICKSAPRSRQITTPVPHHSVFYRPDTLPAAKPTASKHWRHLQGPETVSKLETGSIRAVCGEGQRGAKSPHGPLNRSV